MGRILLAWELGANYGHLIPLAAVAERLRAQGHSVVFAVRNLRGAAEVLGPRGFEFLQAPLAQESQRAGAAPANHAEILALEGYGEEAAILGTIAGWIAIVRMSGADAIGADYAPGALLAGHILGVPRVAMGMGFELPPLSWPMPCIRPWEQIPEARLQRSERQLLRRVNRLLRSFGAREFATLSGWFDTEARILTTFPELDPFGPRPGERYSGAIYESGAGDLPDWPAGDSPRIYAYLRSDLPGFQNLLKALSTAEARTVCFVPGLSPAAAHALASERLRITMRPVQLQAALSDADLALVYGGHGTLCASLAAGVPPVMAPHNVEQYLHAKRVEAIGAGRLLDKDRSVEAVSACIEHALHDDALKASAQRFSQHRAPFTPARAATEVASVIASVAGGSPKSRAPAPNREAGSVR